MLALLVSGGRGMSEIFLSYSRTDAKEALGLADRLRAEGHRVWIDQHGITGAEQWATEIATSIRACSTFLLLLSDASAHSPNVLKELSLASEKRKRIVPIDLAVGIELPVSFEYALAGIQRVALTDYPAVLEAITSGPKRATLVDTRKQVMVLPFEDLSPAQDNSWFADGLTVELVLSLSTIKALRVFDQKTSFQFKGSTVSTAQIAQEFNARYFIEGSVRKFGEQIKINVQLLDFREASYLWQYSHRGEFKEIFDVQETIAEKVVEALKIHLTPEEKSGIHRAGTDNTQAYEYWLKGKEYKSLATKENYHSACTLFSNAVALDPGYSEARCYLAQTYMGLYRKYERDSKHLEAAEREIRALEELDPDNPLRFAVLSEFYRLRGEKPKAEEAALELVRRAPDDTESHLRLALFYAETGRFEESIPEYENVLRLKPEERAVWWNVVLAADVIGDVERRTHAAREALTLYEQFLRLNPHADLERVTVANLYRYAGDLDRARAALHELEPTVQEASSSYNLACLAIALGELDTGVRLFKTSVQKGYRELNVFRHDPDLDPIRSMPEFVETLALLESTISEEHRRA